MKSLCRTVSVFILCASGTLAQESELAESKRFARGNTSSRSSQSFVVPLNSQTGVGLSQTGDNRISGELPWFSRIKKIPKRQLINGDSRTATAPQYGLAFENPIVAFGSSAGGTPLYVGENYSFGFYAGARSENPPSPRSTPQEMATAVHRLITSRGEENVTMPEILISAYRVNAFANGQNNVLPAYQINIRVPRRGTPEWKQFIESGYKTEIFDAHTGLIVWLKLVEGEGYNVWGVNSQETYNTPYILTFRASNSDYYYKIEAQGFQKVGNNWFSRIEPLNDLPSRENLFTLNFDQQRGSQSVFVHQSHFDGASLPPYYHGKSLEELLKTQSRVTKDVGTAPPSYLQVDNSPELWSHPILDELVEDFQNDPLLLSNYVQNEIELTDALSYNDQGEVGAASLNAGGLNRGALATYLEGQGSPAEQCALLIYLLRKTGTPAVYVFPPKDELLMLDSRMSKILRMQLKGAPNPNQPTGTANLPHLIPVNYPWVAAKVTINGVQKWVHLFPWIKDTVVKEGRDLFDKMPVKTGAQWTKLYLTKNPEVFSSPESDTTVASLFPKYVAKQLRANYPSLSLEDLGMSVRDRRHHETVDIGIDI